MTYVTWGPDQQGFKSRNLIFYHEGHEEHEGIHEDNYPGLISTAFSRDPAPTSYHHIAGVPANSV